MTPPKELLDVVDRPPEPSLSFSPDRRRVLQIYRPPPMPPISELARPEVKLAGARACRKGCVVHLCACRQPLVVDHTLCLPPISKRARTEVRLAGARPCRDASPLASPSDAQFHILLLYNCQQVMQVYQPPPMPPFSEFARPEAKLVGPRPSWHTFTHARKVSLMPCPQVLLVATWCLPAQHFQSPADLASSPGQR